MRPQVARPWRLVRQGIENRIVQRRHNASLSTMSAGYHIRNRTRILAPGIAQSRHNRRAGIGYRETHVARLERDGKREALLGSQLFAAMQPAELDEILKFASERRYRRGQTIFQR